MIKKLGVENLVGLSFLWVIYLLLILGLWDLNTSNGLAESHATGGPELCLLSCGGQCYLHLRREGSAR